MLFPKTTESTVGFPWSASDSSWCWWVLSVNYHLPVSTAISRKDYSCLKNYYAKPILFMIQTQKHFRLNSTWYKFHIPCLRWVTIWRRETPRLMKIHEPQTGSNTARLLPGNVRHNATATIMIPASVWQFSLGSRRTSNWNAARPSSAAPLLMAAAPENTSHKSNTGASSKSPRFFRPGKYTDSPHLKTKVKLSKT